MRWLKSTKTPLTRLLFLEIAAGLLFSLASFSLFVYLTKDVLEKETLLFDQLISSLIYYFRTPTLTAIMEAVTFLGSTPIVLILAALTTLFLLIKKRQTEALVFVLTLTVSAGLNSLLKIIFREPRPQISPLITEKNFSYPSGHAMNNLVLYGFLVFLLFRFTRNKELSSLTGALAIIWVGLIGFSRVYLGVHFPSDVIGGFLAGFWVLLTGLLVDKTLSLRKGIKK